MLPLAAALELIHTYSLIHDDLPAMDDDDLRRGRPTCHVRYGEDVAILAGDGLYAEAFRLVLKEQEGEPARCSALAELADATGVNGMVGGQYIDVRGEVPRAESTSARCTSSRRAADRRVGGVRTAPDRGEDPSPTLPDFRRFAAELGVLFQIVDDILDVTGDGRRPGQAAGSDERHGKLTYVTQYGLDGARAMAAESHGKAHAGARAATGGAGGRRARADHRLHRHPHS